MATGYLVLFALGTVVITLAVTVQCCPIECNCSGKTPHHLVQCAYKELQLVPEGLPSNATTLSFTANKIKVLKSQNFVNVTQVTSLWLAHNEIVTIERNTLAPMFQLKNLDMSHNKIVNFPWEDLANLTALQLLKLNNNEMVSLPKDAFANSKYLRTVRINNNKFTTIAEGTFDPLISVSHLQINNNPFTCSCKLEWMRDWITKSKIFILEQNSIICEAPAHLKGLEVTQMPKLVCQAPTVIILYQTHVENRELHEGDTVILNCQTKGSPKPDVEWEVFAGNQLLKFPVPSVVENRDVPINGAPSNTRFLIFQNGTLIIPHMSKKEDGNYSCSATNDMGKAENTVKLAVATKDTTNSVLVENRSTGPPDNKSGPNNPKINALSNSHKLKIPATGTTPINIKTEPNTFQVTSKCGISDGTQYISNHAFNLSLDDLKQYTFDFGVIALEVSETEAKVQLNPLQMANTKSNLHLNRPQDLETVNKEPFTLDQTSSRKPPIDMLYVCVSTGNGHSLVQWSKIEDGVNTYRFQGLRPGTNYTLCLTYRGQDCQVQVVFMTRKKIPSLLIIVVVSIFLLALATVPLLGATCCHLLYKYQGKTYKLIMKTQNADQMEKHIATDFDPRASFVGSDKNFNASELGEGDAEAGVEEGEGEGEEVEGSVVTESIPESQSKTQEEFEVGSEYSDRLPLGAEAVNISEEINGNYKEPR